MNRQSMLDQLRADPSAVWDIVVIGGGATGAGVALDAAARGFRVALVEQSDFGKGTSSRSTKLVHGGVRYLEQGNISLVREALHERGLLRQNAPHLVHPLAFVLPTYQFGQRAFYGLGLKVYDLLAGRLGFGRSRLLSRAKTIEYLPTIAPHGLRGGVIYFDAQFDDARLLLNILQTAAEQGAVVANYVRVVRLLKSSSGKVTGVAVRDLETESEFEIAARVVVNATGPFVDEVRQFDTPTERPIIAPSQGIHLVLPRKFLPSDKALIVPKTRDGRVLFAIPWHGAVVAGTTDTPIEHATLEPRPLEAEIDFVLETLAGYLAAPPSRGDALSTFAGIRPLVKAGDAKNTAKLARDHTILVSDAQLITITGGKWTTYRRMAHDCVERAIEVGDLLRSPCVTEKLPIHGACPPSDVEGARWYYGSDAPLVDQLQQSEASLAEPIHPALSLTAADVVWGVRHEMARSVDDVLARRSRSLLLNAQAATEAAPRVAQIMARELQRDSAWIAGEIAAFQAISAGYKLK
jgi:glycerol-3-phosphate dehydrogenase